MKEITSPTNPLIKKARHLLQSGKARRKHQQAILEGIHLCQSYLQSGGEVGSCIISNEWLGNAEVQEIISICHQKSIEVITTTHKLYTQLSIVEHGIGIMMLIPTSKPSHMPDLIDTAVLLDDIQDPGNVGTILRTAAAAGVKHIFLSKACVDPWSPKVLRAGMGAHFHLNLHLDCTLAEIVATSAIPVFATSSHTTTSLYEVNLTGPAGWIMGNEGQGVSESLLSLNNVTPLIIPQQAEVESLNVSAAAAVCLFEHRRQRLPDDSSALSSDIQTPS